MEARTIILAVIVISVSVLIYSVYRNTKTLEDL